MLLVIEIRLSAMTEAQLLKFGRVNNRMRFPALLLCKVSIPLSPSPLSVLSSPLPPLPSFMQTLPQYRHIFSLSHSLQEGYCSSFLYLSPETNCILLFYLQFLLLFFFPVVAYVYYQSILISLCYQSSWQFRSIKYITHQTSPIFSHLHINIFLHRRIIICVTVSFSVTNLYVLHPFFFFLSLYSL